MKTRLFSVFLVLLLSMGTFSHDTFVMPLLRGVGKSVTIVNRGVIDAVANPFETVKTTLVLTSDFLCAVFEMPNAGNIARFEQRVLGLVNYCGEFYKASPSVRVEMGAEFVTTGVLWSILPKITQLGGRTVCMGLAHLRHLPLASHFTRIYRLERMSILPEALGYSSASKRFALFYQVPFVIDIMKELHEQNSSHH